MVLTITRLLFAPPPALIWRGEEHFYGTRFAFRTQQQYDWLVFHCETDLAVGLPALMLQRRFKTLRFHTARLNTKSTQFISGKVSQLNKFTLPVWNKSVASDNKVLCAFQNTLCASLWTSKTEANTNYWCRKLAPVEWKRKWGRKYKVPV